MKPTPEEEVQIRLLSDGELYRDAITFVNEHLAVEGSQLAGLLEFSRSVDELTGFVRHQKNRDWGEPGKSKKAHYLDFYSALDAYLEDLIHRIKTQYGFIPDSLTNKETRARTSLFASLLAHEFIQHLVAEMSRQVAKEEAKRKEAKKGKKK